ncbi:hypothetical protein J6590_062162 [Homalodisca vitripennis]|nr:hypothetical protein J6590_062162 [Homalodisca vitripennis]
MSAVIYNLTTSCALGTTILFSNFSRFNWSLHSDTLKELITYLETLSTIVSTNVEYVTIDGSSCDTPGVRAPHLPLATSSCLTTVGELRDDP